MSKAISRDIDDVGVPVFRFEVHQVHAGAVTIVNAYGLTG